MNSDGTTVATLATSVTNNNAWVEHSWNLAAYAGRQLYIYFGVHGDGFALTYTMQYVDDVNLSGRERDAYADAEADGHADPRSRRPRRHRSRRPRRPRSRRPRRPPKPTSTPTPKPTSTPKPTPTPTPMPTTACKAAPDSGPFTAGGGHVATGVADAFDFPVQHGCNGAGQTVAVEISSPVQQSDVNGYLAAAGITQTGKITNVSIDGGGTDGGFGSNDTVEATLDVEHHQRTRAGRQYPRLQFPGSQRSTYRGCLQPDRQRRPGERHEFVLRRLRRRGYGLRHLK